MAEVRWLSADEQRTWRAYLGLTMIVGESLDSQLQRDSGMPHGYYEVLVRLSDAPERSMRMSELARVTMSSRSRLSHAVTALESRGWVQRETCLTDRRGQVARLTEAGMQVLVEAAPGHVGAVRQVLFDALTGEQVRQLRDIAEAVLSRQRETPAEAVLSRQRETSAEAVLSRQRDRSLPA